MQDDNGNDITGNATGSENCGMGGKKKCGGCGRAVVGLVLFLSLAGNIYMAGRMAGSRGPHFGKLATVVEAFADLSPESRGKAVDIVKKNWPEVQKQLKAIRATRQEVKKILSAPTYKRTDLEKKFAELRAEVTTLQKTGQEAAADIAGAITPEERLKLCKTIDIKP